MDINPLWFTAKFIREVPPKLRKDRGRTRKERMVELQCVHCKTIFSVSLANAKRIKQTYCSTECSGEVKQKTLGGNEKHPLYSIWLSMRQRCLYPESQNYSNYGARGITIHSDFSEFSVYAAYTESLPNYSKRDISDLTLDRIDNDGHYTYGNLRWATRSTQTINQRKRIISKSPYVGIGLTTTGTKWSARISEKGKHVFIGNFATAEEALDARNAYIKSSGLSHKIQSKV